MERLVENGIHTANESEAVVEESSAKSPSHLANGESELSPDELNGRTDNSKDVNGGHSSNGQFPSVYGSSVAMSDAASRQGYRSSSDPEKILYGNLHSTTPDGAGNGRRRMTSKTNVYVSGLKPTDTQESLASLVQPNLTPKSVTVVSDKDGRSQGYGFLDFKSEDESRAAIELIKESNPKFVVRLANESEKDKTNLYLRGLPKNDTYDEDDLSSAFRNFGEVVSVKIMTERNPSPGNQHPRTGIGFVRFQCEDDAKRALERINENKEVIIIKGNEVAVEAKFADKQVGRSHPNHNSHVSSIGSASGNHHSISAGTRPIQSTVHGTNLAPWILQNGAPIYQQHGLSASSLFRNNYTTMAQAPSAHLVWTPGSNGPSYLSHESWNETNLSSGMASMNISNINHLSNDSMPDSGTHLPAGGQVTLSQQSQANSEPNTSISRNSAMQSNSNVVISRHPPAHQNPQSVDWSLINSHVHQTDTNGRSRHSNASQTQGQATPQGHNPHIPIQPHQLGPNANGFAPFFNINQTATTVGYNANQPNGFIPMVPTPQVHSTEGGYQFTPGGCVFYGNPPIYSSTAMAHNAPGHVNPFHSPSANSLPTAPPVGNITNGSMVYPYQQQNNALQWAAIANNGANIPALTAPHYYQTPHANGYPPMCTYQQPPAPGANRLQHGGSHPPATVTAPQAPAPSSVSVTGNCSVTTAATAP